MPWAKWEWHGEVRGCAGDVDESEVEVAGIGLPPERDDVVRCILKQLEGAAANRGVSQGEEQLLVPGCNVVLSRFGRAMATMDAGTNGCARKLALVEEAHAGQCQGEQGCGAVFFKVEE